MNQDLLCTWFGLPKGDWPPDHYRLLGLTPGETDPFLIEKRVHQKLDEVRCYQCMHPGPATEAMNRLAQAFGCLTDEVQKRVYDETVLGLKVKPPPAPRRLPPPPPPRDPHSWLYTPGMPGPGDPTPVPTMRLQPGMETMMMPQLALDDSAEDMRPWEPPPQVAIPEAPPKDLVAESARRSEAATRGLSSRRALYQRIAHTRRLLRVWYQLGKLVADTQVRLTRQQALEMYRLVGKAEDAMNDFPLMGEAGQPGYLLVTLTRLDRSAALLTLSASQRESLARDWKAGLTFLEAHRDYLRQEAKKQRKRGFLGRWKRGITALLNEQPLAVAAVLAGIAALSIAIIRALP